MQKQIVNRNGGNLIFPFTGNWIAVVSFPVLIFSIVNYRNGSIFKGTLHVKVEGVPFSLMSGSRSALYMPSVSHDTFCVSVSVTVRFVALYSRDCGVL
jgi:hypothetical protein